MFLSEVTKTLLLILFLILFHYIFLIKFAIFRTATNIQLFIVTYAFIALFSVHFFIWPIFNADILLKGFNLLRAIVLFEQCNAWWYLDCILYYILYWDICKIILNSCTYLHKFHCVLFLIKFFFMNEVALYRKHI